MTAFFLGAACGLLFGSLAVTLGAVYLLSLGWERRGLLRLFPSGAALPMVFLAISVVIPMVGAMVGGLLALAYGAAAVAYPGTGLASPNLFFSLAMVLLTLVSLPVWLLERRRPPWVVTVLALAFAIIFGWILPWLLTA